MIYLCETCGKWGGLGLALAQPLINVARALTGEKVELYNSAHVKCPDGHGPMRQVDESVRLQIRSGN